ncbi:MAG: efflux RND transporter periplasmic adaptor subunit [Acidobacteriota bacterium]
MNDEENIPSKAEAPTAGDRPFAGVSLRSRWLAIVLGVAVIAIIATLLLTRGAKQSTMAGQPVPEPSGAVSSSGSASAAGAPGTAPRPGDLVISLEAERLSNARIRTELVTAIDTSAVMAAGIRTTGTVQTNAYKEVPVLPIAGGIVREVSAELGDRVKRGQKLATIFSSELADAQAAYLKMQAEIERHHQHYRRTVELVELGAASREELETATAELKVEQANLSAMKQHLILLGVSEKQIEAMGTQPQAKPLIEVESPASGLILTRSVNPGEVVMTGKELFRVADLSSVWVMGQIYEKDFAAVRVGTPAVITTQAYPGRSFNGRVAYLDPRVEPQTRTAQVRVELANPGEMLKLGMFVDVSFGGASAARASSETGVMVPSAAVQEIGGRRVVFVAGDRPGMFIQREVNAGAESNGRVPVYGGLSAGESVVSEGSFLLRAESLKLNPSQAAMTGSSSAAKPAAETQAHESEPSIQLATVVLTDKGYQPGSVRLRLGVPARVTFVRKVEATCGTELLIPDYQVKRDLPFDEPVVVEFTPTRRGVSEFSCGMKMLRGKIVVR